MEQSNEIKEVRLPFGVPAMTTYPLFTGVLGVLTANGRAENWMLNNYIQLWGFREYEKYSYWTDFKFGNDDDFHDICGCIDRERVYREDIKDIIPFIKNQLNHGRYVYMSLNMQYIDFWWNKDQEKFPVTHHMTIHGYNEEGYILSDFFREKYQISTVDYDSFAKAYDSFSEVDTEDSKYGVEIDLWKLNEVEEKINIDVIKMHLKDFLNSSDCTFLNHLHDDNVGEIDFGIDFLRSLCNYLNLKSRDSSSIDARPFFFIYLQIQLMKKRVKAIIGDSYDCQNLDSMEVMAKKMYHLVLIYNIKLQKHVIESIGRLLDSITNEMCAEYSAILAML